MILEVEVDDIGGGGVTIETRASTVLVQLRQPPQGICIQMTV